MAKQPSDPIEYFKVDPATGNIYLGDASGNALKKAPSAKTAEPRASDLLEFSQGFNRLSSPGPSGYYKPEDVANAVWVQVHDDPKKKIAAGKPDPRSEMVALADPSQSNSLRQGLIGYFRKLLGDHAPVSALIGCYAKLAKATEHEFQRSDGSFVVPRETFVADFVKAFNSQYHFLSYRRDDTSMIAGRVHEHLERAFGDGSVFYDVDRIPAGVDFREHVKSTLLQCRSVVTLIGERWIGGDRILEESDPVRTEIELAMRSSVRVLPVLVGDARMPSSHALPPSIQNFSFLNALRLDVGRGFTHDMQRIISAARTT